MATYKLIQDVEAEDKILGPLTLRQFIFALIAIFLFYLCFMFVTRGGAFLLIIFLPPALFFGFFALPLGRDQPTEIWALAKLRFWFKPRQRIWNQDGVKELVTITAPKKIEQPQTNNLSQTEVSSRLKALANTLDTRGWAVKNVDVNTYASVVQPSSDRLIDIGFMPQAVPDYDVVASDDVLNEVSNPIAQQFSDMITESDQTHRQELVDRLNEVRHEQAQQPTGQESAPANDYWFMNDGRLAPQAVPPAAANLQTAEEAELTSQLRSRAAAQPAPYDNMRTLQPLGGQSAPPAAGAPAANPPAMTPTDDPAILSLANNNDLNVSTIAREANRVKGEEDGLDGEVVVPLR